MVLAAVSCQGFCDLSLPHSAGAAHWAAIPETAAHSLAAPPPNFGAGASLTFHQFP